MNCVFPVEMQLELLIVLWCVKFTKVFSAFLMHHSYLQYLIIFYHQQSAAKKKKKIGKNKNLVSDLVTGWIFLSRCSYCV